MSEMRRQGLGGEGGVVGYGTDVEHNPVTLFENWAARIRLRNPSSITSVDLPFSPGPGAHRKVEVDAIGTGNAAA